MRKTIRTYSELKKWSEAFVSGTFGLFFLIGHPGHAKSWTIKRLVEAEAEKAKARAAREKKKFRPRRKAKPVATTPDPLFEPPPLDHKPEPLIIEGGAVSAFRLYQLLYTHLNETVVLDDVDNAYSDRALVRLLKAVCQSEKVKHVGWYTDSKQLDKKGIPTTFKTKSRVCIIANEWKSLTSHVGSLQSRGVMIDFDPPKEEVFRYIKANKIIKDREVLKYVEDHLWMARRIDIRDLGNAEDAKKKKLDWKDAIATTLGIRDMLLVQELEANKKHATQESRILEFMKLTGLSRPMYFKAKELLAETVRDRPKAKSRRAKSA
jgi:hypothetical protein